MKATFRSVLMSMLLGLLLMAWVPLLSRAGKCKCNGLLNDIITLEDFHSCFC